MKISKKSLAIKPALTRKLYNYAKKYSNVIDLTLGDPDMSTKTNIKKACIKSLKEDKTKYSANAGILELRKAVADLENRENNINIKANENIIITVGAMEALYLTFFTLLDKNDDVIVIGPYYPNYIGMIEMCGAHPIIVNTYEKENYSLNVKKVENAITKKTVAIVLNYPCNPSGSTLSKYEVDEIAKVAKKHNLIVITDEVYKTLLFEKKFESIISRKSMLSRTIMINSVSKRFAMTGFRVGYAIAPKEIIERMTLAQENIAACAPLPSQYAAIEAIKNNSNNTSIKNTFKKRRDYMYKAINRIPKLSCLKPDGTFYLFVNISKTGLKSEEFAYKLIDKTQVAVVPGKTFGNKYDNYIRIALTLPIEKLTEAADRISKFCEALS